MATGGLLLSFEIACESKPSQRPPGVYKEINAYLSINTNGLVKISNPVPEIGQGVRTALPILVAEELGVSLKDVLVTQADADDRYEGRNQRAAGSNSVRVFWEPMRMAGATAKDLILQAAALTWKIPKKACTINEGIISNNLNRYTLPIGELVEMAATLKPSEDIVLKKPSEFKLIGTDVPNPDILDIVSGKVQFGQDIRIPNMSYASIEKSATYGATVISFDAREALSIDGVTHVFKVPFHGDKDRPYCREGIAVVGTSVWAVLRGRKALSIEWDLGINTNESTESLHAVCSELIASDKGLEVRSDGDVYNAFKDTDNVIEAEYHLPFIAHVCMETLNCTVDLQEESCEVWIGSQMPFIARNYLAGFVELPKEKITMHINRIGGGFGRRLWVDFMVEAVKVAQELKAPVQLFWTREDDIQCTGYRPFSYHKLMASYTEDGNPIAWLHRQAGTSRYTFRPNEQPYASEFFPNHFPANLLSNFRQEYSLAVSNLRATLIRAPGNNALAFVVESFMDELAHACKKDPLIFRLELLGTGNKEFEFDEEDNVNISTSRMRQVLTLAAEKASWGKELQRGRGMGIAGYFTFGTYVAHVMEVSVDTKTGEFIIHKVTSAVDCGSVLHPDGVRAQVEGAIIDGISATKYQKIDVKKGETVQTNFHNYPVLRIHEAPKDIEVHIVKSAAPPSGMGEPPYPPVAPALCNAIFSACGKRIRKLPIGKQLEI